MPENTQSSLPAMGAITQGSIEAEQDVPVVKKIKQEQSDTSEILEYLENSMQDEI